MKKNIELELRAEVSLKKFEFLLSKLKKTSKLISKNRRITVMFLGEVNGFPFDIRIRTKDKKNAELVIKKGAFHAHDRVEISEVIPMSQFLDLVRVFSCFNFKSKITERENFLFNLGFGIVLTLVKAGSIAYVEIEKMSNIKDIEKNREKLLRIFSNLDLKLIETENDFNNLCQRLSIKSDIIFSNSKKDLTVLKKLLKIAD